MRPISIIHLIICIPRNVEWDVYAWNESYENHSSLELLSWLYTGNTFIIFTPNWEYLGTKKRALVTLTESTFAFN